MIQRLLQAEQGQRQSQFDVPGDSVDPHPSKYGVVLDNKENVTASEASLPASNQQIKYALVALAPREGCRSRLTAQIIRPGRVACSTSGISFRPLRSKLNRLTGARRIRQ